jgi:hypothetical protein
MCDISLLNFDIFDLVDGCIYRRFCFLGFRAVVMPHLIVSQEIVKHL